LKGCLQRISFLGASRNPLCGCRTITLNKALNNSDGDRGHLLNDYIASCHDCWEFLTQFLTQELTGSYILATVVRVILHVPYQYVPAMGIRETSPALSFRQQHFSDTSTR